MRYTGYLEVGGEVVRRGPGQEEEAGDVEVGAEEVPVAAQGGGHVVGDQGQPAGLQVPGRHRPAIVPEQNTV